MCAQRLIANNPPPAPRLFTLRRSLLTSNIQPLTSAFPCAPLTHALTLDSCFSHQSPACPEHQRRVTNHQSHAALSLFAGGWVAIFQFRFSSFQSISPLECAVTQNAALSPLECAVTKTRLRKSFRMRSYKKTGGRGACPNVQLSNAVYASRTFRRDLHMCNVSRFPCTTCT